MRAIQFDRYGEPAQVLTLRDMLVYGPLTGEPIRVGADPRFILAGHRILEVFWLGEWLKEHNGAELHRLFGEIVALVREGILGTTRALTFSLDKIDAAVKQTVVALPFTYPHPCWRRGVPAFSSRSIVK